MFVCRIVKFLRRQSATQDTVRLQQGMRLRPYLATVRCLRTRIVFESRTSTPRSSVSTRPRNCRKVRLLKVGFFSFRFRFTWKKCNRSYFLALRLFVSKRTTSLTFTHTSRGNCTGALYAYCILSCFTTSGRKRTTVLTYLSKLCPEHGYKHTRAIACLGNRGVSGCTCVDMGAGASVAHDLFASKPHGSHGQSGNNKKWMGSSAVGGQYNEMLDHLRTVSFFRVVRLRAVRTQKRHLSIVCVMF